MLGDGVYMYNTIDALYERDERLSVSIDEICPIFKTKKKAVAYAEQVSNDFRPLTQIVEVTDNKGNVIIQGDCWLMAVIPLRMKGAKYYEVVKVVGIGYDVVPYIDLRLPIFPVFEEFRGTELPQDKMAHLSHFAIDTDGHLYKDGKIYKPTRDIDSLMPMRYSMRVDLDLDTIKQPDVSYIVWAAFSEIKYDDVILLTNNIVQYCPAYLDTTDKYQLEILELRNNGWQWYMDHVDQNASNNALGNLQMCTKYAFDELIDIRKRYANGDLF